MKDLIFAYDFTKLKEILVLHESSGEGLDFRFENYPHNDISVETREWTSIIDFLEWYRTNTAHSGEREK